MPNDLFKDMEKEEEALEQGMQLRKLEKTHRQTPTSEVVQAAVTVCHGQGS